MRSLENPTPEKGHSTVRRKPGAGIKKFVTEEQEDQVGQQTEEDKKSEQRVAYASNHTDILVLSAAVT